MTVDRGAKLRKHVYMTKEAWKIADRLRRQEGLTLSAFLEQIVRRAAQRTGEDE